MYTIGYCYLLPLFLRYIQFCATRDGLLSRSSNSRNKKPFSENTLYIYFIIFINIYCLNIISQVQNVTEKWLYFLFVGGFQIRLGVGC